MLNKQKLIDALEDLWDVIDHQEHDPMQANGVNRAIALVGGFPDDNPWIPVSQQMPDEFTNIDVWVSVKYPSGTHTEKATAYLDKFWWVNGREIKRTVVAWKKRERPEPYEEVSEE